MSDNTAQNSRNQPVPPPGFDPERIHTVIIAGADQSPEAQLRERAETVGCELLNLVRQLPGGAADPAAAAGVLLAGVAEAFGFRRVGA